MFLCPPCHKTTVCEAGWIEEVMPTYGRCERCERMAGCLDCQGYKREKHDA